MVEDKRKYLLKLYSNNLYISNCQVFDLEILKESFDKQAPNDKGFCSIRDEVRGAYEVYEFAAYRHGLDKYGKVHYNNSTWMVVEANTASEAIDIFNKTLEKERKDRSSDKTIGDVLNELTDEQMVVIEDLFDWLSRKKSVSIFTNEYRNRVLNSLTDDQRKAVYGTIYYLRCEKKGKANVSNN